MAARPPQSNDEPREPAAFGIAAVDDHLSDANVSYPATPDEVATALDDPEVQCGPDGHDVELSTVLDRTGREEFDSRRDMLDELHDAFEAERHEGGGFIGWLRSLVS